jgi:hypothetical protein
MVEIFFKNKIQSDRLFVSKLFMFGCTLVFGFFHLSLENPQNGIWFWMFLGFLSARE